MDRLNRKKENNSLYFIEFTQEGERRLKIGITNNEKRRFTQIEHYYKRAGKPIEDLRKVYSVGNLNRDSVEKMEERVRKEICTNYGFHRIPKDRWTLPETGPITLQFSRRSKNVIKYEVTF